MSNYKRYFKDSLNPVFITLVTYNRLEILIQNIDVLRNSFKYAKNSMKHYQIVPKDWKFSSFNKFVQSGFYEQDWCNFEDKYKINNFNLE